MTTSMNYTMTERGNIPECNWAGEHTSRGGKDRDCVKAPLNGDISGENHRNRNMQNAVDGFMASYSSWRRSR